MLASSLVSRLTTLAPRVPTLCALVRGRTATPRIRGRALQHIRTMHALHDPLCVECAAEGHVEPWTDLDHIVALVNGGAETPSNRQGLCKRHHDAKTKRDIAIAGGRK